MAAAAPAPTSALISASSRARHASSPAPAPNSARIRSPNPLVTGISGGAAGTVEGAAAAGRAPERSGAGEGFARRPRTTNTATPTAIKATRTNTISSRATAPTSLPTMMASTWPSIDECVLRAPARRPRCDWTVGNEPIEPRLPSAQPIRSLPAARGAHLVRGLGELDAVLGQALGDHLGRAVVAHRDAVEHVRHLHRALLVGDHQDLRAAGQVMQHVQE